MSDNKLINYVEEGVKIINDLDVFRKKYLEKMDKIDENEKQILEDLIKDFNDEYVFHKNVFETTKDEELKKQAYYGLVKCNDEKVKIKKRLAELCRNKKIRITSSIVIGLLGIGGVLTLVFSKKSVK